MLRVSGQETKPQLQSYTPRSYWSRGVNPTQVREGQRQCPLVSCLQLSANCPWKGGVHQWAQKGFLSSKESILELSIMVLLVIQALGKLRQEDNCKFDLSEYL